jgi:hypothetical protein
VNNASETFTFGIESFIARAGGAIVVGFFVLWAFVAHSGLTSRCAKRYRSIIFVVLVVSLIKLYHPELCFTGVLAPKAAKSHQFKASLMECRSQVF